MGSGRDGSGFPWDEVEACRSEGCGGVIVGGSPRALCPRLRRPSQVFWTFFSVIGGGFYFEEFKSLGLMDAIGFATGVSVVRWDDHGVFGILGGR